MHKTNIQPEDLHLIPDTNTTLLIHSKSLQIYPLSHQDLLDFIQTFKELGFEETKKAYEEEDFTYLYKKVEDQINMAPKSISENTEDTETSEFKAVVLPISANCNLNCPYCFAQNESGFQFGDFTEEDVKRSIDFIMQNKQEEETVSLTFFGGEPLLKVNLIRYCIDYCQNNFQKTRFLYSITTNGTILNQEILELVKANQISLLISLDGPNNAFNLRRFKNGDSSVEVVLKNIKSLRESEIDFQIRATITNQNTAIVETFQFFEELACPFHVIFAYSSENKGHQLANYDTERRIQIQYQLDQLIPFYLNRIQQNLPLYNASFVDIFNRLRFRAKQKKVCSAGINYFTITAKGLIYTCPHLMNKPEYAVGNIEQGLLNRPELLPTHIDLIEECKNCWARYLCVGGCPSQKIATGYTSHSAKDPNACQLERMSWEMYIKLYYQILQFNPLFFTEKEDIKV